MEARSSPGGFVVAAVTNPGSFMATITHPTGNGYCRDRILRDRPSFSSLLFVFISRAGILEMEPAPIPCILLFMYTLGSMHPSK